MGVTLWVRLCGRYSRGFFNCINRLGPHNWPLYGVSRWLFFRGWHTMEVYVSSIGTRAVGRYIEGGCCRGVTVKRGSTVVPQHSEEAAASPWERGQT